MNYRDIVLPGDDNQVDDLVRDYQSRYDDERYGPRFCKSVVKLLRQVCETYYLDPVTLADQVVNDMSDVHTRQIAVIRHECDWRGPGRYDKNKEPEACKGFIHRRWYATDINHYTVLMWDTPDANEVCAKLKKYFKPITTGSTSTAGGISLPDLGDLEKRVGLSKFMEEEF